MRLFAQTTRTHHHTPRHGTRRPLELRAIESMAYPNMSAGHAAKRLSAWATGAVFLLGLLLVVTFLMSCGVKSSPRPRAQHWYERHGLAAPAQPAAQTPATPAPGKPATP